MVCEEDKDGPKFDPSFTESVIAHMNGDHADALLLYVRAFTKHSQARSAAIIGLDRQSMQLSVGEGEPIANIAFIPPLRDEGEVRLRLVGLAKQAREQLGEE